MLSKHIEMNHVAEFFALSRVGRAHEKWAYQTHFLKVVEVVELWDREGMGVCGWNHHAVDKDVVRFLV